MANGKFWSLVHNNRAVFSRKTFPFFKRATGNPTPDQGDAGEAARFKNYHEAEKAAQMITKEYGGDVYIMESIALATVPTTIVKIEG